jgi:hypothetical protein
MARGSPFADDRSGGIERTSSIDSAAARTHGNDAAQSRSRSNGWTRLDCS